MWCVFPASPASGRPTCTAEDRGHAGKNRGLSEAGKALELRAGCDNQLCFCQSGFLLLHSSRSLLLDGGGGGGVGTGTMGLS